jgi:aspartate kinase
VEVESGQTIVSIVGNEIGQTEHVLEKLFTSIRNIPVTMVSFGGSPHNISLLIPASHKKEILQALNKGLFGL